MVCKWYILPIERLYITYHLLREPGFTPLIIVWEESLFDFPLKARDDEGLLNIRKNRLGLVLWNVLGYAFPWHLGEMLQFDLRIPGGSKIHCKDHWRNGLQEIAIDHCFSDMIYHQQFWLVVGLTSRVHMFQTHSLLKNHVLQSIIYIYTLQKYLPCFTICYIIEFQSVIGISLIPTWMSRDGS